MFSRDCKYLALKTLLREKITTREVAEKKQLSLILTTEKGNIFNELGFKKRTNWNIRVKLKAKDIDSHNTDSILNRIIHAANRQSIAWCFIFVALARLLSINTLAYNRACGGGVKQMTLSCPYIHQQQADDNEVIAAFSLYLYFSSKLKQWQY